ncbi:hypothetical protein N577_009240 [Lacticaseibacillus rhamnosus 2166]|nr:hypothetical protein N577_009240 [Lacticaseibacillus rhamnosus 2166]
MYKNLKQLMDEAQALDYTVGAFNAHNLEMVPPMITAAKDAGSPIIIQTSVATAEYVGMKNFVAVCKSMAEDLLVDVDLHLDHAKSFDAIKEAIDAGYSSVMFDGSAFHLKKTWNGRDELPIMPMNMASHSNAKSGRSVAPKKA